MKNVVETIYQIIEKELECTGLARDWGPVPKNNPGDLAIPCFRIGKALNSSPPQTAQRLEEILQKSNTPLIKSCSAAGPYLNIHLNFASLRETICQRAIEGSAGKSQIGEGKTVCLDFSSPNIAKEMAFHHLRSTAIGNSLANIAAHHGYKVKRINYLGDWGTTHGKLLKAVELFGSEEKLKSEGISYMLSLYIEFNRREKEDPSLSAAAKEAFCKLEEGDENYLRLWKLFRDLSISEFEATYERLGIRYDEYDGESFYREKVDGIIDEIDQKMGTRISEGALVTDIEGMKLPILLKKDDGASLYITRDLCAVQRRFDDYKFDVHWYVVAHQQKLHFQQLFKTVEKLERPYANRCEHIGFGMLSFGDKTMSSRKGNVIFLNDVLNEAKDRALKIIEEKNPNLENKHAVADAVGLGAVIFSDLSQNRSKDVKFRWESISFEGDTAPFIQYTFARCNSLLEKLNAHQETLSQDTVKENSDSVECEAHDRLLREWLYFDYHCERALLDKDPSQVAHALLKTAKAFNRLYHDVRFLDETCPKKLQLWMAIIDGTQSILKTGLSLLGIQSPQKM